VIAQEALLTRLHVAPALQDTTTLCIARMLASNSSLRELSLSKHKMVCRGSQAAPPAPKQHTCGWSLQVDSQFETLVTYGLLRNSTLTALDLRANKLSGFSGESCMPAAVLQQASSCGTLISHLCLQGPGWSGWCLSAGS
jgi:hypothetical protein